MYLRQRFRFCQSGACTAGNSALVPGRQESRDDIQQRHSIEATVEDSGHHLGTAVRRWLDPGGLHPSVSQAVPRPTDSPLDVIGLKLQLSAPLT